MLRRPFGIQSDPLANPQFRCCWTVPPPERKRRPGANGTAHFEGQLSADIDSPHPTESQARRATEALFSQRGAA